MKFKKIKKAAIALLFSACTGAVTIPAVSMISTVESQAANIVRMTPEEAAKKNGTVNIILKMKVVGDKKNTSFPISVFPQTGRNWLMDEENNGLLNGRYGDVVFQGDKDGLDNVYNGADFTMKDGQQVKMTNLPIVNTANNQPVYRIQVPDIEGWDISVNNDALTVGHSSGKTVTTTITARQKNYCGSLSIKRTFKGEIPPASSINLYGYRVALSDKSLNSGPINDREGVGVPGVVQGMKNGEYNPSYSYSTYSGTEYEHNICTNCLVPGTEYTVTATTMPNVEGYTCTVNKSVINGITERGKKSVAEFIYTFTKKPTTVAVTGVTLNKTSTSIKKGTSQTLTATVKPDNASNKAVTWSSSNTKVATVNNGVVKAVGEGTAEITVKTIDGGKTATCKVTVPKEEVKPTTIAVTGVTLNKTSTSIKKGTSQTLTATVKPDNASNKAVTWSSSNTKVATVNNGVVKAVGEGTATITVKTTDGSKTATCKVTVPKEEVKPTTIAVTGVTLNKTSTSIKKGTSQTLTATVKPDNASNKAVTWSSSNTKVATVSNGVVKAIGEGVATITVKTADGSKTAACKITVPKQDVSDIFTGFRKYGNEWYYVERGNVVYKRSSVTYGIVNNQSGWWNVKNGKVIFNNSVENNEHGWWVIRNGKVDFGYSGFAKNTHGWWYIENGKVIFKHNGVTYGEINGEKGWWSVIGGNVKFEDSVEGNEYGWWVTKKGKVDFGYSGFAKNTHGWWYIENGKVIFKHNGVTYGEVNGEKGWWSVIGGNVKFEDSVEGNDHGWWVTKKGKVDFGYSGFAKNTHGWWYIENGKVIFKHNGVTYGEVNGEKGWWSVIGGNVKFEDSVEGNDHGWWVTKKGKVDFGYSGFAKNTHGWWYIENGKVIFKHNGVTYGEVNGEKGWWNVENGRVILK